MKKTKIINMFGSPGAGKSTTAAGVFSKMKLRKISCEYSTEYCKDMVFREMNENQFADQLYITAKQHHKIFRLKGKVNYIITDSPLILGSSYSPPGYFSLFAPLVEQIFNSYDNINFFVNRVKEYDPFGRNQTEEGSDEKGRELKQLLIDGGYPFYEIDGDENAADNVLSILFKTHERENNRMA